jgi:hypothetical protein
MGAIVTERRTAPPRQLTLAERVSAHMETWPGNEFGGWIVAEDHRDGSAVVVWRQADWGGNVRGNMLYRWLGSLRDAGFTAEARLDMEALGRPDEMADIAHWLHVTAYTAPPCASAVVLGLTPTT